MGAGEDTGYTREEGGWVYTRVVYNLPIYPGGIWPILPITRVVYGPFSSITRVLQVLNLPYTRVLQALNLPYTRVVYGPFSHTRVVHTPSPCYTGGTYTVPMLHGWYMPQGVPQGVAQQGVPQGVAQQGVPQG